MIEICLSVSFSQCPAQFAIAISREMRYIALGSVIPEVGMQRETLAGRLDG